MSNISDHAKWEDVVGSMSEESVDLEESITTLLYQNPKQFLNHLAIYKFVSKLVGEKSSILQLGLDQALGGLVFEKECGALVTLSENIEKISSIKNNWPNLNLLNKDIKAIERGYDTIVINPFSNESYLSKFLQSPKPYLDCLNKHGLLFLGFKKNESEKYQAVQSHLDSLFRFNFTFSSWGEVIQPGISNSADYLIYMGCLQK